MSSGKWFPIFLKTVRPSEDEATSMLRNVGNHFPEYKVMSQESPILSSTAVRAYNLKIHSGLSVYL
jgi:hypothetical protein